MSLLLLLRLGQELVDFLGDEPVLHYEECVRDKVKHPVEKEGHDHEVVQALLSFLRLN
jgi:hypothetical protein